MDVATLMAGGKQLHETTCQHGSQIRRGNYRLARNQCLSIGKLLQAMDRYCVSYPENVIQAGVAASWQGSIARGSDVHLEALLCRADLGVLASEVALRAFSSAFFSCLSICFRAELVPARRACSSQIPQSVRPKIHFEMVLSCFG